MGFKNLQLGKGDGTVLAYLPTVLNLDPGGAVVPMVIKIKRGLSEVVQGPLRESFRKTWN